MLRPTRPLATIAGPTTCPPLFARTLQAARAPTAVMVWAPADITSAVAASAGTVVIAGTIVRRLLRLATIALALWSAWFAYILKKAGSAANPERSRAGQPIRCPWPFVLVATPWSHLGRRSLRAGLWDWQTWIVVSLLLLCLRV